MRFYRVTKYNPSYRDINGSYILDDWTSVSDIGKKFNGSVLTENIYLQMEDNYIEYLSAFLKKTRENFNAQCFEDKRDERSLKNYSFNLDRCIVGSETLRDIIAEDVLLVSRMCLRELVWCKLESDFGDFIHFGYDYYMYLGFNDSVHEEINWPSLDDIYVEDFVSPYI